MIRPATKSDGSAFSAMIVPYVNQMIELGVVDIVPTDLDGYHKDILEFWGDAELAPCVILADDRISDFSMVNRVSEGVSSQISFLAEFYVIPDNRSIGYKAAHQTIAAHPGAWHLWIADCNASAHAFWRSVLSGPGIADHSVETDDDGQRHRLTTSGGAS